MGIGQAGKRRRCPHCDARWSRIGAEQLLRGGIRTGADCGTLKTQRATRQRARHFAKNTQFKRRFVKCVVVASETRAGPNCSLPLMRCFCAERCGHCWVRAWRFERELHRRPAGVSTSAFVCMGIGRCSRVVFELAKVGDTSGTRIDCQLGKGIGFLGARGNFAASWAGCLAITTAATIFVEGKRRWDGGLGGGSTRWRICDGVLCLANCLGWVAQNERT